MRVGKLIYRFVPLGIFLVTFGALILNIGWFVVRLHTTTRFVSTSAEAQGEKPGTRQRASSSEGKLVPASAAVSEPYPLGHGSNSSPAEDTSDGTDAVLARELARRRRALASACSRLRVPRRRAEGYPAAPFMGHVLVLDSHRLLFGSVPKVASAAFKQLLSELVTSRLAENGSRSYTRLDGYSAEERDARLESYRRVVFVREPVTRLVSAWLHAFRDGGAGDRRDRWRDYLGRAWSLRRRRGAMIGDSVDSGEDPCSTPGNATFAEFARCVTSLGPHHELDTFSDRFLPQSEIVGPCQMDYQFIGRFEALALEGPYLLRWLSLGDSVTFPRYQPSAAARSLRTELAKVPLEVLRGLSQLYQRDYELFGYSFMDTMQTILQ